MSEPAFGTPRPRGVRRGPVGRNRYSVWRLLNIPLVQESSDGYPGTAACDGHGDSLARVRGGGRAEAGTALLPPAGLSPGYHFRFVFVTDGIRDATSSNITDYNNFVTAQANGATYNGTTMTWAAIASTPTVNAIDNVGQTQDPVYSADGTQVTTTTTTAGLWSGTILTPIDRDLTGLTLPSSISMDGYICRRIWYL